MRFSSSVVLVLAALAGLGACSSSGSSADPNGPVPDNNTDAGPAPTPDEDSSTSITIGVDSEDLRSQGLPIASLEVVTHINGVEKRTTVPADAQSPTPFPYELKIYAPKDKTDAELDVQVNLIGIVQEPMDGDGPGTPPLVTRLAKTHFVKGVAKLEYLYLETRCNHAQLLGGSLANGPTCDETANTCIGGKCTSADLPTLPDYYADWKKTPPSECGSGSPEITTVGHGLDALVPLADGDTVTLEQGPQCGHHFYVALSMKNFAQSGTTVTLSASQPGTSNTVPATGYPYRWTPTAGGACELDGLRLQVDVGGTDVAEFLGKALDVRVDLADRAGHAATATRHVMVAPTFDNPSGRNCSGDGG